MVFHRRFTAFSRPPQPFFPSKSLKNQRKTDFEALEQQPDEPSLVKLKNDLTEVIVLTEDLVKYQAAAPTEAEQQAGAETAGTAGRASVVPQAAPGRGKAVHTALVGRTCEAFFEQKWYNGRSKAFRKVSSHENPSKIL